MRKIIQKPITASVITVLIIITGVYGSLYSDEIKKSIFIFPPTSVVIFFILLVAISGLLFFIRQGVVDTNQRETINTLNNTIRTQPPD